MATTLNFKDIIDLPKWRPLAPAAANSAAGSCLAYDMRNSDRNTPFNFYLINATTLWAYSPLADEWLQLASPALTGTFGAGAACVLHPTQGPRGTIAAGATTTTFTLTTALPAAVGVNQLANRGDGEGFYIRVIGNSAGGSGKTEAKRIIANTAGTTPTITVESAFTFTPALGDAYEIRSGRLYMLSAGTLAAGMWKHYDLATNSFSGNLATTNLPATVGGDSSLVALSEGHVPNTVVSVATGFLGELTSTTGNSSTTIVVGSGISVGLQTNEYRNFQIRITEDTATPTSVGQRRRIASHTSGTTPTFTVASWAVTPSATAKFVVENDDDKILLFTNQTSVYTYNITANTWDTTTFAAAGNAGGAGIVAQQSFGIARDASGNARHSFIFRIRGGNVGSIDVLDIAGAATGSWSAGITYGNSGITAFNTGTSGAYDPITLQGRYLYLNLNATQRNLRFDMVDRVLEPFTYLRFPQGAALVGGKMAMSFFMDGSTKLSFPSIILSTSALQFQIAAHR
jgi:hypothetical protein